jgi:hypothetical protein
MSRRIAEVPDAEVAMSAAWYQPMIKSWNRAGIGMLDDRHVVMLYDRLEAAGHVQYTYMVVVFDKVKQEPVLYVTSEVNSMAEALGGGSHFLCIFDPAGHHNMGCSDEWADAAKFFPKAIELAAERFGADPKRINILPPRPTPTPGAN